MQLFFSHMSYCVTVWSKAYLSTIKPFASLYNQALKIMDNKAMRWHKNSYLKLVFKCLQNLAPDTLCMFFSRQSSRMTRGTASGNCKIAHHKTSFGQSAFSIKGSQMWNILPTGIKLRLLIKMWKAGWSKIRAVCIFSYFMTWCFCLSFFLFW